MDLSINTLAGVKAHTYMSALPDGQNTPPNSPENGQKVTPNDKEYNFAQIRQQLEREKQEKNQLKEEVEKLKKMNSENLGGDDDDYDEPYIDRKRLRKELGKVVEQTKAETDTKIEHMVTKALSEERKQAWLKEHPDFEEVVQHAQKVEDHDPDLAKMISVPSSRVPGTGRRPGRDKGEALCGRRGRKEAGPIRHPSAIPVALLRGPCEETSCSRGDEGHRCPRRRKKQAPGPSAPARPT